MIQTTFSSLGLSQELLNNIESLGYQFMTDIQAQSLPHILAGKDVIAQGKTGSGKTAAFGLGILQQLDVKTNYVQSLVLCPTRELADQVANEIRKLARTMHNIKVLTLCGGMPFRSQVGSLEHGAHIIVGTPGRVEEHLRKANLNLDRLTTFVLDEADRMLDMGFQPALDEIVKYLPDQRQTLLLSATFPVQIESMAQRIMLDPVMVQVTATHDSGSIKQHFYKVATDENRTQAVSLLLLQHRPESAVVFCNTKLEVQSVADALEAQGFDTLALHGDLQQRERDQALVRFANKSVSILVATDLAARGLDIDALDMVVNYHIGRDPEVHIHRIGRTGRAGSLGVAHSFYSDKECHKVARLEEALKQSIKSEALPSLSLLKQAPYKAAMATIQIDGGKKQKVRAGDILGALTGESGVTGKQVGKIQTFDNWAYVAINRDVVKIALKKLADGKIKGRLFRCRQV